MDRVCISLKYGSRFAALNATVFQQKKIGNWCSRLIFLFVAVFRLHLAHTLWVPSVARLLRAVPAPLLDAAACVRVAKSVARACRFLHHALPAPVVHGDLTVANVLLTDEGVAKLCDFGLSRTQHQVQ
jgi:hypothetical protein